MKPWIVVFLAIALAVVVHHLATELGPAPAPTRGVERTDGQAVTAAPSRPMPRFAVDRRAPARPDEAAEAEPEPGAGVEAEPAPPESPPDSSEIRDRFEAFFAAETADPSGSQEAANSLTRDLKALLPSGSGLRQIECHDSLCRIESSHADIDEFRQYAQRAFLDFDTRVASNGFFASLLDESGEGASVAVAYVAREGKSLPTPETLLATP